MATGVIPYRPLTRIELDDAIFVSAVPTVVRIARAVETRAFNRIRDRIALAGMKEEILRVAPSDDKVREMIDTMSLRELGLWIHHNDKRLEKAAKEAAAAAAAAKKQARAQVAQEKKDAMKEVAAAAVAAAMKQAREKKDAMKEVAAAAVAAAKKQARENQIQNDEVVFRMMIRKRKG